MSLRTKRGAAAAGLTVAGSILLGVVGNLAANTVGDIGSGWKPAIWIALGVLAAVAIVSAVVKTLRGGDSAAESRRHDETGGGQRRGKRKRPWQLKAMFAVWGLLAALALVGTVHAIVRPASADIERIYLWAFDAQRNDAGAWDMTPAAMIAVFLAVFGWLTPPFFAARNVYDAVPRSAGPTVRALATSGGFVFGGWAGFFGSLAGFSILATVMPPSFAANLSLLGVFASVLTAMGWASEGGLR